MKIAFAFALMIAAGSAVVSTPAYAVGCVSGGVVGGVAGHMAGHHSVLGAAAGCAIGHHEAVKQNKAAAAAKSQQNTAPATTQQ